MARSMTAFGQARRETPWGVVEVSISSTNRRHLEVQLHLPSEYWMLEPELRALIGRAVQRGMIRVQVRLHREAKQQIELFQQRALLWQELASKLDPMWDRTLSMQLLTTPMDQEEEHQHPGCSKSVMAVAAEALEAWQMAREVEGQHLVGDLLARLKQVQEMVETSQAWATQVGPLMEAKAKERLVGAGEWSAEERDRLWREIALLVDRADATEEVVRLQSHLVKLAGLLQDVGEVGKPLDFYLQELLREANTLGSKLGQVKWGHTEPLDLTVQLKTELERMREQVQNLE